MTGEVPADDLLRAIAAFATERVAPAAVAWSMGEAPGPDLFAGAGRLGLTGLEVSAASGGRGTGFAVKVAACAQLAAADFGFAMSVVNTHNVARRIELSASPRLKARHLPDLLAGRVSACTALTEPGAGSDVPALSTRAERVADGWRLTGEKSWIINARHAGLCIVYARCIGGDGDGIGAFLVDLTAPGVTRYPLDGPFAQTSMGTGGFTLDGVAVADDQLLLAPDIAFKAILSEINGARAYVAAMCCAMLAAAIRDVSEHGARRRTFGVPLEDHQDWRFAVARARVDLAAAQALVDQAVREAGDPKAAQLLAAAAKVHAVETCQHHLPRLLHAMGAEGLRPEHCLARHLGAVQSAALTDGTTAMLLERIARLARPPAPAEINRKA